MSISRFNKIFYVLLAGMMVLGAAGCTKKQGATGAAASVGTPSLDDARAAVIDAEQKLGELRAERLDLQNQLDAKKSQDKKNK
jgi:hypothetical protein